MHGMETIPFMKQKKKETKTVQFLSNILRIDISAPNEKQKWKITKEKSIVGVAITQVT
jgi:hypothetical protein